MCTLVGDIHSLDHLSVDECYNIFHTLSNLDHLNSCFYKIILNEQKLSRERKYPGYFNTVFCQDKTGNGKRHELNMSLELNDIMEYEDYKPREVDKSEIYAAVVLFVNNRYTGHVYIWQHPNVEFAVRVQGIRTSVANYKELYFRGVGKTLIDSIVTYATTKGYRYITVWDPIGAMPNILLKYGFNRHYDCPDYILYTDTDYFDETEYFYSNIFHYADYIFDVSTMSKSPDVLIQNYIIEDYKYI